MPCNDFARLAKRRITIQTPTYTTDAFGGQTVAWSNSGTYWAHVKPVSGRERYAQERLESVISHVITIRYVAALRQAQDLGDWRILYDSRVFKVHWLRDPDEAHEFIEFHCEQQAKVSE